MDTFIRKNREDGSNYALVNPKLDEEVREIVTDWVRDEVHKGICPSDELYDLAAFVWEQVEEEGENTQFDFYSEWSNFSGRMYDAMIEEMLENDYAWDGRSLETLVLMFAHTLIDSAIEAQEQVEKYERVKDEEEE
jgi:hypothetical protein